MGQTFKCDHCKSGEEIKGCNEKGETVRVQMTDGLCAMKPDIEIKLTIHADTENGRKQVYLCLSCVRHLLRPVSIH